MSSRATSPAQPATFALWENQLKAYFAAVFGAHPVIRTTVGAADGRMRRTTFDNGFVTMPDAFPGFADEAGRRLFLASVAHVGAHMLYTRPFQRRALSPIQIALVSTIEDARVEQLVAREFPGLGRLWRSLHVAVPGARFATGMMASLARALSDESYYEPDSWVQKGRDAFFAVRADWTDQSVSRRIGSLLGSDLSAMRIRFNAPTYTVEPAYRDDNLGIWSADDVPAMIGEAVLTHVRLELGDQSSEERQRSDEGGSDRLPERLQAIDKTSGVPVGRYPEWDYSIGQFRRDWTTIVEYEPQPASTHRLDRLYAQHADAVARIARLVSAASIGRPSRRRRQPEGERLDMDASIEAMIQKRVGVMPEMNVYETNIARGRDLSVLVLLDVSESTRDFVKGTTDTVLDLERAASALLAEAIESVGDSFAVHAFCSDGRSDVRYYRIKDFDGVFDRTAKARLAGLRSAYSTRMGAALRHAGAHLRQKPAHRRLLLIITDGEPADVDVPDAKYLIEDARRAVQSLAADALDVFCVAFDNGGDAYLSRIFGRRNVLQVDRLAALPEKLPMLYVQLTR